VKWHDDTKSRVTDLDEATARLSQYVLDRGNEQVNVDVYGPATDSGKQEQEALQSRSRRRCAEAQARPRYGPLPRRAPL
jgi:hypothetical protein